MIRLAAGMEVRGLAGTYRVGEAMGAGGFATTHAGQDADGQDVVLKELHIEHLRDWKALDLFGREAKVLAQLSHPGIPRYFDFFAWDGETAREVGAALTEGATDDAPLPALVLVQERLFGTPLSKVVEGEKRLTNGEVERLLRGLLEILVYLQELHPPVFHRDVNPNNVLLGDGGQPCLVDFGAVQDRARLSTKLGTTQVGTVGFMPIEQLAGSAGPSTDLYALGLTLLCCSTQSAPHELPRHQDTQRIDVERAVPQVPERIRQVLAAMTEPLPGDRVATARAALNRLEGKVVRGTTSEGSRRATVLVLGALALAAGMGSAVVVAVRRDDATLVVASSPEAKAPAEPPEKLLQQRFIGSFLPVELNDDGQVDVVAWTFADNEPPIALDGLTGKLLWVGAPTGRRESSQVTFQGDKGSLVSVVGRALAGLDRMSGAKLWGYTLPDLATRVSFGVGCVVAETADEGRTVLDAAEGTPRDACEGAEPAALKDGFLFDGPSEAKSSSIDEQTVLTAHEVGKGTSRLELRATRGDEVVWSTVLEEVKAAGLFSAPGGIVAVGHDRFNPRAYWVYLIDDETGAVVARTSNEGTTGVHNLRHHVFGSRVLTHTRGVLHAYDSTTLEERWRAGDDP